MCAQEITDEKRHGEKVPEAGFLRFRGKKLPASVLFGKKVQEKGQLNEILT